MAPKSKTRNQKSIVLGVTGSIAAYKSAELASLLVKQNHNVFVVMTNDANEFITPLTLQTLSKNPVMTSFFDEKENWRPGHIELADNADLLLIAPATANVIAELALGLAGHPLAAIALATRAPILIAPAMNGKSCSGKPFREAPLGTLGRTRTTALEKSSRFVQAACCSRLCALAVKRTLTVAPSFVRWDVYWIGRLSPHLPEIWGQCGAPLFACFSVRGFCSHSAPDLPADPAKGKKAAAAVEGQSRCR